MSKTTHEDCLKYIYLASVVMPNGELNHAYSLVVCAEYEKQALEFLVKDKDFSFTFIGPASPNQKIGVISGPARLINNVY